MPDAGAVPVLLIVGEAFRTPVLKRRQSVSANRFQTGLHLCWTGRLIQRNIGDFLNQIKIAGQ